MLCYLHHVHYMEVNYFCDICGILWTLLSLAKINVQHINFSFTFHKVIVYQR